MEFKKSYLKIIIIAASVAAVFAGASAYSLIKYTTSAKHFCMSCHWNQGDSNFSKPSAVHPEYVSCDDCHAKNAGVIPTGFTASPELVNKNCIRCHENMQFTNEWDKLKTNVQDIQIKHQLHLEKAKMSCVDCHNNVAHDRSPNSTNRPHMAKCFECHTSKEGCESCHPLGFLKIDSVTEDFSVQECSECHIDFLHEESKQAGKFSHKRHLLNFIECDVCHDVKGVHPLLVIEDKDCAGCHHEKKTRDCINCHPLQEKLYFGIRDDEEWPYPDIMASAGMTCDIGCHVELKKGHSFGSIRNACIICHGEEYGKLVDEFQTSLKKSIKEIEELLSNVAGLSGKDVISREGIAYEIKSAEEILGFIEKAKGVHNMQYTLLLINDTKKRLMSLPYMK